MANKRKAHADLCLNSRQAQKLAGLPNCSVRQAAEVAVTLAHDEAPSEQDKKREAKSITNGVAKAASEYKQTYIEELNVDGQTVYVTNLQLLLQRYCQQSREFAKAVREALSCVSEPLSMVAYVDETVSGNPLNPCNPKKSHLIYLTFLEMGPRIGLQEFWLVGGVITNGKAASVCGGLSEVFKNILLHWHHSDHGILHRSGFSVELEGEHWLFRCKLHALITDEAALRSVLGSKGAAGMKPCSKCYNIVSKWHGASFDLQDGETVKDITEANYRSFLKYTDQEVFDVIERLRRAHDELPQNEIVKREQVYGFSFCSSGLLADPIARCLLPPSRCYYDFLHCLFSNGIACIEVCLFWDAVKQSTGLTLHDLQRFCEESGFNMNRSVHDCRLKRVFDSKYIEKPTYGGDASHCVLALFILEVFARHVLSSHTALTGQIRSLTCLSCLCRWYFRLKAGKCKPRLSSSELINNLVAEHLGVYVAVYGKQAVKPKHHFNFHCAEGLDLQSQTLDCWATERKHRVYKNCGKNFPYNGGFESAVLNKLLMVQEEQLKEKTADPCLLNGKSAPDVAAKMHCISAEVAQGCRYNYLEYHSGVLCFFDNKQSCGGQINHCLAVFPRGPGQAVYYLCLKGLERVSQADGGDAWHFSQWRDAGSEFLVNLAQQSARIFSPILWWKQGNYIVVSY